MKFKDINFYSYYKKHIKFKTIIVFADNKKALIINPNKTQKILGDYRILYIYTIDDYINKKYHLYIHLNISSKDYKKILGY